MKSVTDVVVERICKFLGEQNITQYKLAQLSDIPAPTLKSIMQRRTKNISLKTVMLIAKGFGMSVSEFLDEPMFDPDKLNLD